MYCIHIKKKTTERDHRGPQTKLFLAIARKAEAQV